MAAPYTPATALARIAGVISHPDVGVEARLVVEFVGGPGGHPWAAQIEVNGHRVVWGLGSDPTSALIALATNADTFGCDPAR